VASALKRFFNSTAKALLSVEVIDAFSGVFLTGV
jgi:hypothetical protein